MEIEDLPSQLGLKRSIALLSAILFIAGGCTGYILGFEDATHQASQSVLHASEEGHILHAGEHYFRVSPEINNSKIEIRGSLIYDSINKTP